MSFNCIFLFILLSESYLITYAKFRNTSISTTDSELPAMKCLDCSKQSRKLCPINETGYSCYDGPIYRRQGSDDAAFPETTTDLDVCIPPDIKKFEFNDAKICCIWAPETGCQILLTGDHQGDFCFTCRVKYKMEYKKLKACPCIKDKGSGQVNCKVFYIIAIGYFLRKLIY
ncbi:uncharacterized protein LOC108086889 [Drosophila ficusphila]|uniref:uncharacterized protein LOC108086889 n=1 Tax=Drosophila ficusphila TaxID=30025 RepID=UPI0007E60135|nr:uncharacterized protein LOC108086889 [Drosophila ficusphila]